MFPAFSDQHQTPFPDRCSAQILGEEEKSKKQNFYSGRGPFLPAVGTASLSLPSPCARGLGHIPWKPREHRSLPADPFQPHQPSKSRFWGELGQGAAASPMVGSHPHPRGSSHHRGQSRCLKVIKLYRAKNSHRGSLFTGSFPPWEQRKSQFQNHHSPR